MTFAFEWRLWGLEGNAVPRSRSSWPPFRALPPVVAASDTEITENRSQSASYRVQGPFKTHIKVRAQCLCGDLANASTQTTCLGVVSAYRGKKKCTRCKREKLEKLFFTQFLMKYPPPKSADLFHHAQAKEKRPWRLQHAKDTEVGNCRGHRAIRLATAFHRSPPTCQLLGLPSISINPRETWR